MPAPPSCFRLEREGDTTIITPLADMGELNKSRFDGYGTLKILSGNDVRNVVVDFHKIDYIGSNAVNLLIGVHKIVQAHGGQMLLCRVSPHIREVMQTMKMDRLCPIYTSREEALQSVGSRAVRVLVVDDTAVERHLVGNLLNAIEGIEIEYAENGVDALDKLKRAMFNLVLTDLMMPMMDGLQLLDEVSRLYPQTPVVLMTAYGNELLAVEALERGAASYVPKDQKADRLVDTVKKVLARSIVRMNGTCLHDCSAKLDASFNLENDPAQFSRIIDMIQQMFACIAPVRDIDLVRLGIALDEALSNALYHGNLELTLDDLQKTRNSPESLASLTEQRRQNPQYKDRRISLDVHLTPNSAKFVVSDDGPGFDNEDTFNNRSDDCLESGTNRGTVLMRALMDTVSYNDLGNKVTLVKDVSSAAYV